MNDDGDFFDDLDKPVRLVVVGVVVVLIVVILAALLVGCSGMAPATVPGWKDDPGYVYRVETNRSVIQPIKECDGSCQFRSPR